MTQSILDIMGRYTELRKATHNEYMGPCPKCADGDDRLRVWVDQGRFWCRVCGWQGDTIDVIRGMDGLSFVDAKNRLGLPDDPSRRPGAQLRPACRPAPTTPWVSKPDGYDLRDPDVAHDRLFGADPDNVMGYLEGRGLDDTTIKVFRFGADRHKDLGPVVTIPWVSHDGIVVGVKTRVVDPPGGRDKNHSYRGSQFGILYGAQGLLLHDDGAPIAPDLRCLVVVEGEVNAASIWQACNRFGVDVLSVGAQSAVANLTDRQGQYLRQWGCRIVWLDEDKPQGVDYAATLHDKVGGLRFASSMADGLDANDLLGHGVLGCLIAKIWLRQVEDDDRRQSILWGILDAASLVQGIDTGTAQLCERLAHELGYSVALYEAEPGRWLQRRLTERA